MASSSADSPIAPPTTLEERIKRFLVPPRLELARITQRELKRGEPELRLLPFLLDPDRAAMDIGANRGIWAGQMALHCSTVWAFEPNPKLFTILERAAAPTVACRREALSDQSGEAVLMIPGEGGQYSNQGASLSETKLGGRAHMKVTVTTATLDSLNPPATGLLKIDVEGHERAVLDGARGLISRDRPTLIIEMEERHTGRDISEDVAAVEALGYKTYVLKRGHLVPVSDFDAELDHRSKAGKPGYINNFIFLPT